MFAAERIGSKYVQSNLPLTACVKRPPVLKDFKRPFQAHKSALFSVIHLC